MLGLSSDLVAELRSHYHFWNSEFIFKVISRHTHLLNKSLAPFPDSGAGNNLSSDTSILTLKVTVLYFTSIYPAASKISNMYTISEC